MKRLDNFKIKSNNEKAAKAITNQAPLSYRYISNLYEHTQ